MPAYRFCRPDDIPLLVQAIQCCSEEERLQTGCFEVEQYKKLMQHINLWPSSCMIAMAGKQPIAVLYGCKRAYANFILEIAVHPEHRRQGHASHLLNSLSRKLAVLGPPLLETELDPNDHIAKELFRSAGYRRTREYQTLQTVLPSNTNEPSPAIGPITIDQAIEHGLLDENTELSWRRQTETLVNAKSEIQGVAFASPNAIEACLFYRQTSEEREVLRWSCVEPRATELLFSVILQALQGDAPTPITIPKLSSAELDPEICQKQGFQVTSSVELWQAEAVAG